MMLLLRLTGGSESENSVYRHSGMRTAGAGKRNMWRHSPEVTSHRLLLEKLTFARLYKAYKVFYGRRNFNTLRATGPCSEPN